MGLNNWQASSKVRRDLIFDNAPILGTWFGFRFRAKQLLIILGGAGFGLSLLQQFPQGQFIQSIVASVTTIALFIYLGMPAKNIIPEKLYFDVFIIHLFDWPRKRRYTYMSNADIKR